MQRNPCPLDIDLENIVSIRLTSKLSRRNHESSSVRSSQGVWSATSFSSSPRQEGSSWQVLNSHFCHFSSILNIINKITGKSSPMMENFSAFSMVGVYETRKGLKFVHITSEKFAGKFTVLIFMDNRLKRKFHLVAKSVFNLG